MFSKILPPGLEEKSLSFDCAPVASPTSFISPPLNKSLRSCFSNYGHSPINNIIQIL